MSRITPSWNRDKWLTEHIVSVQAEGTTVPLNHHTCISGIACTIPGDIGEATNSPKSRLILDVAQLRRSTGL